MLITRKGRHDKRISSNSKIKINDIYIKEQEDDETLFVGTVQKYSLVIDSYLVRQPEFFYKSDIGKNLAEKEEDTSGRKLWSRTVTDEKGEEEKEDDNLSDCENSGASENSKIFESPKTSESPKISVNSIF